MLSGLDGYIGKVNRQLCPLYYAMPKNSGGRSVLSLSVADSTTAAGRRLTACSYITTCTNSPSERRPKREGGRVKQLREQETEGERQKMPLGRERGRQRKGETVCEKNL